MISISSTALVIIDLQKGIVGAPALPHSSETVVRNASKLAFAFRERSMPVFLVRVTPSADGKDALHPIADADPAWRPARTADWAEIVPELNQQESDFVITKRQWGAFTGTELDLQLRRRRIDTIVLCGVSTNFGVESTARFAYELGYQQIFVEDACSARSEAEHQFAFSTVFPRIGRIRATEIIIEELQNSGIKE